MHSGRRKEQVEEREFGQQGKLGKENASALISFAFFFFIYCPYSLRFILKKVKASFISRLAFSFQFPFPSKFESNLDKSMRKVAPDYHVFV